MMIKQVISHTESMSHWLCLPFARSQKIADDITNALHDASILTQTCKKQNLSDKISVLHMA